MLQNKMQKGTGFRRIKGRPAAFLCFQAIPQKIDILAAVKGIHAGCGNPQLFTIQGMDNTCIPQRSPH